MPDDPTDELELVKEQTSDDEQVIAGIDPNISQDVEPPTGG